jgi:aspartyl-tRNA(Asn)/glutamyl-tRNA(Gln) amidotransferase subunit C
VEKIFNNQLYQHKDNPVTNDRSNECEANYHKKLSTGASIMDMKTISKKEVEHIAMLARIEITEEEKELFSDQFTRILRYFGIIDDAETEEIDPTYQSLNLINIYREDIVEPSIEKKEVLRNAKNKEESFFKSPPIV